MRGNRFSNRMLVQRNQEKSDNANRYIMYASSENAATTSALGKFKRILPLVAIALAVVAVFAFDLDSYLSFDGAPWKGAVS